MLGIYWQGQESTGFKMAAYFLNKDAYALLSYLAISLNSGDGRSKLWKQIRELIQLPCWWTHIYMENENMQIAH
jgi:hypothetical protein